MSKPITFRVPLTEYAALLIEAEKRGIPLSNLILMKVLRPEEDNSVDAAKLALENHKLRTENEQLMRISKTAEVVDLTQEAERLKIENAQMATSATAAPDPIVVTKLYTEVVELKSKLEALTIEAASAANTANLELKRARDEASRQLDEADEKLKNSAGYTRHLRSQVEEVEKQKNDHFVECDRVNALLKAKTDEAAYTEEVLNRELTTLYRQQDNLVAQRKSDKEQLQQAQEQLEIYEDALAELQERIGNQNRTLIHRTKMSDDLHAQLDESTRAFETIYERVEEVLSGQSALSLRMTILLTKVGGYDEMLRYPDPEDEELDAFEGDEVEKLMAFYDKRAEDFGELIEELSKAIDNYKDNIEPLYEYLQEITGTDADDKDSDNKTGVRQPVAKPTEKKKSKKKVIAK